MNEIKVTTELCAEDRARIDRLTAAIEGLSKGIGSVGTPFQADAVETESKPEKSERVPEPAETLDGPETAPEPVAEDTPTEAEPEVKEVPEHTQAELQQKVISLVSAGKRDETRAIIKQYAERASAIPTEKINEVWDKLTALEG